jgi:DNA replicative helicase MCM subunit Mcm2 (Cdc46/Mcm family)
MVTTIQELNVSEDLKKCGVTRLAKESSRFLLEYQSKAVIIFTIEDNELFATLQDFEDRSKGRIDRQTQEAIKFCLSKDEYYVNALLSKANGNAPPRFVIGQESTTTDQHYEENSEQTQTETLSVEQAIRRNKGRLTVPGMIIGLSSVEQVVTLTEFECSNCKYSFEAKHNPPLFSLPFSVATTKTRKCPNCNESTYGPHHHEEKSAIII